MSDMVWYIAKVSYMSRIRLGIVNEIVCAGQVSTCKKWEVIVTNLVMFRQLRCLHFLSPEVSSIYYKPRHASQEYMHTEL